MYAGLQFRCVPPCSLVTFQVGSFHSNGLFIVPTLLLTHQRQARKQPNKLHRIISIAKSTFRERLPATLAGSDMAA